MGSNENLNQTLTNEEIDVKIELAPDELVGIKRESPMTFEKADSGNVNPRYGSERGYAINCQSCVVVFEARLRGYNVEAQPNIKGSMAEKLSYKTNLAWIDPSSGSHPEYIYDKTKTFTAKSYKNYLESKIEQGNRYTIEFSWKGGGGHIVNIDRNEEGLLRIKDNQRGKGEKSEWIGDREILQYLSRIKYSGTTYGMKYNSPPKILRIDNMMFDENVINEVMKGKQS